MIDIHRNTHPEIPICFHYAIIIIYYVQTSQVFTLELFWNRTLTMQSNCEAEAYRQEPGQSKIFSYEAPVHYLNQVPQCSSLSRASLWLWHTQSLGSTFTPLQTVCSMRSGGWFWSTFSFGNAEFLSAPFCHLFNKRSTVLRPRNEKMSVIGLTIVCMCTCALVCVHVCVHRCVCVLPPIGQSRATLTCLHWAWYQE